MLAHLLAAPVSNARTWDHSPDTEKWHHHHDHTSRSALETYVETTQTR